MNAYGEASPLNSHALGTASNDLIRGCETKEPKWATLPSPPKSPALALALSGGGFRATLSALGVLRFLADAGLLSQVRYSSSVSGGSIANGLLAATWPQLDQGNFTRELLDRAMIKPFVDRISRHALKWRLIQNAWKTIGPKTRTEVLADVFDDWFFHLLLLEGLTRNCRFIFNAANLATGVRFGFERDVMGDWVLGNVSTQGSGFRLARAVAASAAVPGAFAPLVMKGYQFPCANGRVPLLVDGGAYDNSGLEPVDDLGSSVCLVAMNAGGLFRTGYTGKIPIIRDLKRANSILYRQSTALRRRMMVERFQAWERSRTDPPSWGRRGVLFGLATSFSPCEEWSTDHPEIPSWLPSNHSVEQWRSDVALISTSFDKFDRERCRRLVYRGWWLTGATLATYHRDVLPAQLPVWEDLS